MNVFGNSSKQLLQALTANAEKETMDYVLQEMQAVLGEEMPETDAVRTYLQDPDKPTELSTAQQIVAMDKLLECAEVNLRTLCDLIRYQQLKDAGVVNQPPPKWSSVKKWLLHINYAPGYAPEPEQKPVCRQFSRCEGCPYPAHGFLCWGGEDDCMRTRVKKLNEKELEHEDQSGFV